MHPPTSKVPKSEVSVLLKATEGVFRKLIRLLVGRISLKKLQQLIQIIFIEESEAKLRREMPNKNPTLVDTALLTGVDTRTIKKIKKQVTSDKPIYQEPALLDNFMPMFNVLDLWVSSEDFVSPRTGRPRQLKVSGDGATFSRLVGLALPSRGLSVKQVLKKLEEFGAVSVNDFDGTVKLIQQNNIFISKEFSDSLDIGFAAIENLVDTVSHNLENLSDKDARFFQRVRWNCQFDPETLDQDREKIGNHICQTDKVSGELLTSLAQPEPQQGQVTVGVGMYYFEKENK